jgi:hypothetical protein
LPPWPRSGHNRRDHDDDNNGATMPMMIMTAMIAAIMIGITI